MRKIINNQAKSLLNVYVCKKIVHQEKTRNRKMKEKAFLQVLFVQSISTVAVCSMQCT